MPSHQVREMVNDEEKRLARQMIPNYLIVDGNVDRYDEMKKKLMMGVVQGFK